MRVGSPIRRHRLGFAVMVLLAIVLVALLLRPYAVADWLRLRSYVPSADISAIVTDTTMTSAGQHLFYINHPAIQDKAAFRDSCPKYDNQTITIGCYRGGQRGIYVLDVDDERLDGVEEVTAAHEMLHAAYERLSRQERQRINDLLQAYADSGLTDERVKSALKGYEKTEPGQQHNEMHSMFGTEIANLPAELEEYYSRYFTSRQTVVQFAQNYQAAFTSRESLIEQYDSQLAAWSAQIKSSTQSLDTQANTIENDRARLDAYRATGAVEQYNAGVAPFNNKVNAYNGLLAATKDLVTQYNTLVEQRNAIAAQTVELQQAIDSSSLPASQ